MTSSFKSRDLHLKQSAQELQYLKDKLCHYFIIQPFFEMSHIYDSLVLVSTQIWDENFVYFSAQMLKIRNKKL